MKAASLKSILPVLGIALLAAMPLHAQVTGDYESVTFTGNFSDATSWQVFNGSSWQSAASSPTSSNGTITIQDGNSLNVSANVTLDQTTISSLGQLTINPTRTLTIGNGTGTDLTVNGTLLNSGNLSISAGATWTVGANGTYIHNATTSIATPLGSATLAAGSTFIYRGSSTLSTQTSLAGRTYSNLAFESSSGAWTPGGISGSSAWTVNGALVVGGANGTVNLGYGSYNGTTSFNGDITVKSGSNLGGNASNGARSFTVATGKTLTIETNAGVNVAGNQTVTVGSGGSAAIASGGYIAGPGNLTIASGASLSVANASGLDGAITVNGTKTFATGANYAFQVAGGLGATMPVATNDLTLAATSGTTTLDGSGSTLTVNGTYSQAGGTLAAGTNRNTLILNNTASDSNPAAVLSGGASMNSAVNLQFSGSNATILRAGSGSQSTIAGSVDLGNSERVFEIVDGAGSVDLLISGQISNGAIFKTGLGTLALSGSNNYAGGTTIQAGTLLVLGSGTLGSTSGFVTVNGGILDLNGSTFTASTFSLNGGSVINGSISATSGTNFNQGGSSSSNIGGSGGVSVGNGTTVTLSGSNSYSGATTVNGTLIAGSSAALSANSSYTVTSGSALQLNGNNGTIGGLNGSGSVVAGGAKLSVGSGSFSGNISSSGELEKTGTGNLTLSGTSNTLGSALVSSGTLVVAASGATGGAPVHVVNNGHFRVDAGVNSGSSVTLGSELAVFEKGIGAGQDLSQAEVVKSNLVGGKDTTVQLGGIIGAPTDITFGLTPGTAETLSDIVTLKGLDGTAFVLVMYAAPGEITSGSFLGWLDPTSNQWKLATVGNKGDAGILAQRYEMSYQSFIAANGPWNGATMLGAYGVDTAGGSVWAVIDHNSDFGAVPEPCTYALLILGGGTLCFVARRKKHCV